MKELKSLMVVVMVSAVWGLLGPLLSVIMVGIMFLFDIKFDSISASFAFTFLFAKLMVMVLIVSYLIAIIGVIKTYKSLVHRWRLVKVSMFSTVLIAVAVMIAEAALFINIWE